MPLMKNIFKNIEKNIDEFTKMVAEKHGLDQNELLEMWENVSKMKMSNGAGRINPWLQFCKEERIRLKQENPTMPFGEISKIIGKLWSDMSDDEKSEYKTKFYEQGQTQTSTRPKKVKKTKKTKKPKKKAEEEDSSTEGEEEDNQETHGVETMMENEEEEEPVVNETTISPSLWTMENLKKMKIADLRKMCSEIKLSKTGKKEVIIERLLDSVKYQNGSWVNSNEVTTSSPEIREFTDEEDD